MVSCGTCSHPCIVPGGDLLLHQAIRRACSSQDSDIYSIICLYCYTKVASHPCNVSPDKFLTKFGEAVVKRFSMNNLSNPFISLDRKLKDRGIRSQNI